ncbi:MAG: cellulose biosynthesis protein BcsS [Rhodopseudomonas sp.]|uniref:cellulose biosynthesis protein BcsS n=1 Tax=Rhodopseudomonas sp. TaxID=1078 RepID=UPI00183C4FA8|nr:cellulose biosynthesis protein BcsS [Rhodopseudomonas sp.]NVN86938.1 cellulose biosynthesis protein BcsS [Rhodopseudomonas sp.]
MQAKAADWYTGASEPKPSKDWIVAVDSSATATSTGAEFASVTGTVALDQSLNVSGTRLRIETLAGTYKYDSSTTGERIRGDQAGVAVLGGYQWIAPRSALSVYGGVDVRDWRFSGSEVGGPSAGVRQGLKTAVEYYASPSDRLMLFAYGSYSTIYNAYYGRVKLGLAALGPVYVGPELAALGDDFYRQWRIGGHVTGLQLGGLQFGVSAGYQIDKSGSGGAYGSLDIRAAY